MNNMSTNSMYLYYVLKTLRGAPTNNSRLSRPQLKKLSTNGLRYEVGENKNK